MDKPKKADFEKDLNCMIDCVKVQPHLSFKLAIIGAFFALFGPFAAIVGIGVRSKTFL